MAVTVSTRLGATSLGLLLYRLSRHDHAVRWWTHHFTLVLQVWSFLQYNVTFLECFVAAVLSVSALGTKQLFNFVTILISTTVNYDTEVIAVAPPLADKWNNNLSKYLPLSFTFSLTMPCLSLSRPNSQYLVCLHYFLVYYALFYLFRHQSVRLVCLGYILI